MKLKSSIKTLEIEDAKGKKKVYGFETGDPVVLETWISKFNELKKLAETNLDGKEISALYNIERDLIVMVLGEKAWKEIKRKCNNSVYTLFPVLAELMRLINESSDENAKMFELVKVKK